MQKHSQHESIVNMRSMHCADETFGIGSLQWGGKSLIHAVEDVRYSFLKRFPPILVISADGWVPTRHSLDPELRAVTAQKPSRAGTLELAFLSGLATDGDEKTLHPIHADLEWRDSPETVRQITVHSNTNQVTTMVGRLE
jgi:hypothetical protein